MIHLAQLGAGHWGPNLIRNFMQLDEVGEFTVCDLEEVRLKKMHRRYPGIRITQSVEDVLTKPEIDAVVIAIPAALHYEYAKKALLAGKHVLVEKPLAMTTKQAEELIALAKAKEKVLMVGHTFLFNAAVLKAKQYIDSGELGEIYYILSQRLNLGRVRQDVNAMWNLAPHDISIILYWLDEEPSSVSAKGLTFLQEGIEDVVLMDLVFPSGRAAHIHISWLHPQKTRQMTIVGSKKMLVYDDVSSDAKIVVHDKGVEKTRIPRVLPDVESFADFQLASRMGDIHIPKIDFKEPLSLECQHFIECIFNGSKPIPDGENGRKVVKVLEEAQGYLGKKWDKK